MSFSCVPYSACIECSKVFLLSCRYYPEKSARPVLPYAMSSSTAAPFIEVGGGGGNGVGTAMTRLSGGSNASAGSGRSLAGCGLCRGPLRDSRVLPGCLHSFCLACLQVSVFQIFKKSSLICIGLYCRLGILQNKRLSGK